MLSPSAAALPRSKLLSHRATIKRTLRTLHTGGPEWQDPAIRAALARALQALEEHLDDYPPDDGPGGGSVAPITTNGAADAVAREGRLRAPPAAKENRAGEGAADLESNSTPINSPSRQFGQIIDFDRYRLRRDASTLCPARRRGWQCQWCGRRA